MTTNKLPQIIFKNTVLRQGVMVPLSDLFSFSDPDGDKIMAVAIKDNTFGGSQIYVSGIGYVYNNNLLITSVEGKSNSSIVVYSSNINDALSRVYVESALFATKDSFFVNATDGKDHAYIGGNVYVIETSSTTAINSRPVVDFIGNAFEAGKLYNFSDFFSVFDPDGVIKEVYIRDNTDYGARLQFDGKNIPAGQTLTLTTINNSNSAYNKYGNNIYDLLARVTFLGADANFEDVFTVNAYDGDITAYDKAPGTPIRTYVKESSVQEPSNPIKTIEGNCSQLSDAQESIIKNAIKFVEKNGSDEGRKGYANDQCVSAVKDLIRESGYYWGGGQGNYNENLEAKINNFTDLANDSYYEEKKDAFKGKVYTSNFTAKEFLEVLIPGDIINYYHRYGSGKEYLHTAIVVSVCDGDVKIFDNRGKDGKLQIDSIFSAPNGYELWNPQILRLNSNAKKVADPEPAYQKTNIIVHNYESVAFDRRLLITSGDDSGAILMDNYSGPVAWLKNMYIGGEGWEAMVGSDFADFLNSRGGDDAIDGGRGDDVLDGGLGSNFLTGGPDNDTFFVDGRGGGVTWSTVTDLEKGEWITAWGWREGTSKITWAEMSGAEGAKGATAHIDLDGKGGIDMSMTIAGKSSGALIVTAGQVGDNSYLAFTLS